MALYIFYLFAVQFKRRLYDITYRVHDSQNCPGKQCWVIPLYFPLLLNYLIDKMVLAIFYQARIFCYLIEMFYILFAINVFIAT